MPIRVTPTETPAEQPEAEAPRQPEANSASIPPASTNGSGPRAFRYANRYEELDHTDLLHVIDELEGDRNWASLREKLWIALIIHLLIVWYLFYGPKYIYHVRVVDPSVVLRQRQKDLTFLNLPPDALRPPPRPKPTNIISDKNRVAETPHPTLDRKTLEELEAMRRAGPPAPTQAPPAQTPAPAPPPPQVAQQQRPTPPAQPLPQNNQARLDAPPMAPIPNINAGSGNPNEQLQQEMRQAMRGGGGGDAGMGQPSQQQGLNGAVDILSDTMGVDFGPYIQRVIWDTEQAWWPIIPDEARPPFNKQGQVYIRFKILPNGNVVDMHLDGPSGDVALDRAAWAGITGAAPFPPLPRAFKGPFLELRFDFLYNLEPGQQ